ncbi:hypothetical protein F441_16353 [Phytophthora nicotianae CJ01A1]|uniref:Uncharacterized protein n=5 Tax=Phytophthora nicotianae TaxID=4792 RepID=W2PRB8_PHYN3|nr:hypothetical protein PPTG_16146 [Phytophthora nicotianae INRA-310]ETI37473.1 hypothetical protein F443_16541 [Phytophthora nicotianae P1569]ETK77702.1 hypothetical protein L915_16069 [Phytophthora nicotianae]ETO66252.1 hypothetical protein F444_16513 [Phytophthora nicotianae P1976]ETP07351.1 hypothetical protein F441_16353 [Phytophthora nicotianae CJ01A1]ETL31146.1 hypothetical protein L916_15959 [Phytophthora nicotianae]
MANSTVIMKMNGRFLAPTVNALSALIKRESLPEHKAELSSLASRRRAWLLGEIADISKPFTYELPPSDVPEAAALTSFLRGPDSMYIIRDFTGIAQARYRVALLTRALKATGLTMTAEGRGRNSYVRLEKAVRGSPKTAIASAQGRNRTFGTHNPSW